MTPTMLHSTADLATVERQFLAALRHLRFGRLEHISIRQGQVVISPWPTTIRCLKLGSEINSSFEASDDFALKRQVVEFFEYVRSVQAGEIRCLEVKHGLPFSMEVEHSANAEGGASD